MRKRVPYLFTFKHKMVGKYYLLSPLKKKFNGYSTKKSEYEHITQFISTNIFVNFQSLKINNFAAEY